MQLLQTSHDAHVVQLSAEQADHNERVWLANSCTHDAVHV